MTLQDLLLELSVIRYRLATLLDAGGRDTIALAEATMRKQVPTPSTHGGKKKPKTPPRWTFEISPQAPLSFQPTEVGGHRYFIDAFCRMSQPDDTGLPAAGHTICVRVWSEDASLCYREHLDAATLRACGRRVILRFHFDHANARQPGPRHHLQIGGGQQGAELSWFPENIKVPRFCHHPVSLLMACEFIVRTFFPNYYNDIAEDGVWRGALAKAQAAYLAPYYRLQAAAVRPDDLRLSLLGRLWNPDK